MNTGQHKNDYEQEQEKDREIGKEEEKMNDIQYNNDDAKQLKNNDNFFLSKKPRAKKVITAEVQNTYLTHIKRVLNQSPHLEIEVTNSNTIEKGTVFKINPFGLENSMRQAYDGYTYFGFEQDPINNQKSKMSSSTIDYSIKPKENNYEDRYIGLHFQIFFNPADLKYYISDLGYGFGTFKKISSELEITENSLINIGNSYLVFSYNQDDQGMSEQSSYSIHTLPLDKGDKCLYLKVFSSNTKYELFAFHPKLNKVIYIGRDTECNVMIDDSLLSRFHCTINYNADGKWIINDGKIKAREIKLSTNGTWIYLMEDTMIDDGMIFKGNQNIFKCHIIKNVLTIN